VTVQLRIPAPSSAVLGDGLGVAGLVAIVVCVGGMVGNWWISGVLAGVAAMFLSWAAAKNRAAAAAPAQRPLVAVPPLDQIKSLRQGLVDLDRQLRTPAA
jgi:hypothetical protein